MMGCFLVFLFLPLLVGAAETGSETRLNTYPIVLLHGWTGWGRSELGGRLKYWGGWGDLQEHLKGKGYETHTAAVGPISSNWDRACELYAFIKGGKVDYGLAHATRHGHSRYGREYDGILPSWGELDDADKRQKIHILSHSMGGQTGRQLIELLYEGSAEEINYPDYEPGDGPHTLFQGGKNDWVHSLTTLSTPHDGSTLANAADALSVLRILFKAIFTLLDDASQQGVYDLKLDQWETLVRGQDESFEDYLNRVLGSDVLKAEDFSVYDLSPEGARELNRRTSTKANIYYFSWATKSSTQNLFGSGQHGDWQLLPLFAPLSLVLGSCTSECMWRTPDPVALDQTWFSNDGIVNTRSMHGPTLGSKRVIIPWADISHRGRWNNMGTLDPWDHFDIIGLNRIWPFPADSRPEQLQQFYERIAAQLSRLPE